MVLNDLTLRLEEGSFVTIIGRSGSGKSTFLDLVMGLEKPSSGVVEKRAGLSMGYVFQRPALLPWRSLLRNVALPLEIIGRPRAERKERAMEALRQVGLDYAGKRFPFQLSGGMSQRAAIARALVQDPDVLLMDEPFSALDPLLRENLNINLVKLWQRTRKTILFVTHSIDEAVLLSDRILILENGSFIKSFEVGVPRPRTFETLATPEFAQTVREIHEYLPAQPNLPRVLAES